MKRMALFLLLWSAIAQAVQPDEQLADPKLEARAREISQGLRCVVCQNQSIDDSDAPLARDLRVLLREQLVKGATDQQAKDYLVARYGNYVLLSPPFQLSTLALWLGPLALLLGGGLGVTTYVRRRRAPAGPEGLTAEEQQRLDTLLKGDRF
jgi:cytochrome c-type biogenesis protein CcmH